MQLTTVFTSTLAFVALVSASAIPRTGGSQCNTGPIQCCNQVQSAGNSEASNLAGILGILLNPNVPVGLTCSPITLVGASSTSCNTQTVCCEDNSFNGLIALGCTPINLSL